MRRTIYINKIRRTLLTLCLMATATMAWAVDVSTAEELKNQLATSNTEFRLTADITLSETIELTQARSITIDLAGHTLTAIDHRALWVKCGTLTLNSTGTSGKISVVGSSIDHDSSVIRVGDNETNTNTASLVISKDVTVETDMCYGVTAFGNNNNSTPITVTIEGTINTKIRSAVAGNGSAGLSKTYTTIGENAKITTEDRVAIYHPQDGQLVVKGTVEGAGGIEMKGGQIEVQAGAKITATQSTPTHSANNNDPSTCGYAIAIVENGEYAGVSTVNINPGAEINGPVAVLKDSENSTTAGAAFNGLQMAVKVTDNTDKVVGQFLSVELAVENAPVGATVTLLANNSLTSTIETTKNYTLDLNGKTLTSDGQCALWVKSGNVKITSATAGAITVPTCSDASAILVGNSETTDVSLTVDNNVTISANQCSGIILTGSNTNLSLTVNGKVNSIDSPAIVGTKGMTATSTITVDQNALVTSDNSVAIYQPQNGSLSVNGTVIGAGGIELKSGSLSIGANANIKSTGTPTHVAQTDATSSLGYAIAIVENDAYTPTNPSILIDNSAKIFGTVAELQDSENSSFAPNYNGNAVSAKVAAINNDEYFTLKDAIDIVPSSGTVELLGNLSLNSTLLMDKAKTYTLDLDGKTLTGGGCAAVHLTHGHVTIANGTLTTTGSTEAIRLGSDEGGNRNITLTINSDANVTSTSSTGILLSGTATRETLDLKGNVTTTDHSAIVTADEVAKIHVATGAVVTANNTVAIYQVNTGELVVDGTVKGLTSGSGTSAGAIEMKGGNLTVSHGASITATGTQTHSASTTAPSTNGYAIALVENASFPGVGKANIDKTATITGVIACIVDSKNVNAAEPMFTGDIYMIAETDANGDKYAKLDDAIYAATTKVKLLDDITVTKAVAISKAITFDMDDYSIINNQTSVAAMTISANATIKNGGIVNAKTGTPAVEMDNAGISVTTGTVTLENMTVDTKGVSLSVSGGTVSADAKSSFSTSGSNTVALSGGSLTMNGKVLNTSTEINHAINATTGDLTIESTATVSSANSNAINWASAGNLLINGGKIAGAEAVYASAGKVTIDGGTFTGKNHGVEIAGYTELPAVNGGTFICGTSSKPITAASATGFVKGNYFSDKIDQTLCYAGYMVSTNKKNNGMYYLVNEIVIYDGTDWNAPSNIPFTIATARYIRNTGMGTTGTTFGTLCLPFSYSVSQTNMTFYKVESIDGDVLNLTHYTGDTNGNVPANTPVIFQFTEKTTSFEIISNNASVSVTQPAEPYNQGDLAGTFVQKTIGSGLGNIYYLNSDAFHQATKSVTVPAYRAYIYYPSSNPNPAKPAVLYIHTDDEEVDNIASVIEDNNVESIYDLQGRKQNTLQSGMNIIKMSNGKTIKVYVK